MSEQPNTKPPPIHERDEYRSMRDALAEQLIANADARLDRREEAWDLANKIAPVLYVAVEHVCTLHHMNTVQNARGMMLALERIQQLDELRVACTVWAHKHRLTVTDEMRTPSERALLAALDAYTKTRAKDN